MKTVLISGASGFVGKALTSRLQTKGWAIRGLSRSAKQQDGVEYFRWSPSNMEIEKQSVRGVDAVIHLAGANVADGLWTKKQKAAILGSRVDGTKLLKQTLSSENPNARFISASAIGIYGPNQGDRVCSEESPAGDGFLADVVKQWEGEIFDGTSKAAALRIGLVLGKEGGLLKKLLPVFKLGAGGRLGDGSHWMSWISVDDLVDAFVFLLENPELSGAFNACAPNPVTNKSFTKALAKAVRRPAIFPVPRFVLRTIFGEEMTREIFFSSVRVSPKRLTEAGFSFEHEDLDAALNFILQ